MYNASEHTFNKNKTMNACLLLPVSSQGQHMIIRLKVYGVSAMYICNVCRQLEESLT